MSTNGSNGHTKPPPDVSVEDLARSLEVIGAQRDAALQSLRELVDVVRRTGGYMSQPDQTSLNHATAMLEAHGIVKPKARTPWRGA